MRRRVEFAETDMAGILHFSNYYRFMESAEHDFFRSLGLRVHEHREDGVFGWARGEAACRFLAPLHNEELVELHLLVREKRQKTLSYDVVFHRVTPDGSAGERVAHGTMTTVCIAKGPGGLRSRTMPAEVNAAIDAAPPELLPSRP